MRRALDAYRFASDRGASPGELVHAVITAHEIDRVELETSRCRASTSDVAVVRRLADSRALSSEEAQALVRLADLADHHLREDIRVGLLHDPVAELERT